MTVPRLLGSLLAVLAIVLAPSAALAYEADDDVLLVSETNPAVGEPFTVRVDAGPDSDEATLTVTSQSPGVSDDDIEIAGTQSMTKATNAGVARFTVTLYAEGRYSLVGFDAAGNRVGQSVVVVGDGLAGEGGDDESLGAVGDSTPGGLSLPLTGVDGSTALLGGAGLLLLGGGVVLLVSRRRSGEQSA
jgi:LPXTG-motif cell wall-anchored protein